MTTQQLNLEGMGRLYVGVLEQATHWRDGRGLTRRLEELDRNHLARLEPFLLRKGETLRWRWMFSVSRIHHATGEDVYGREVRLWSDGGGNLDRAFDEWLDYEMRRPLAKWLADRPLIRRIRELLEDQGDAK